MVSVQQVRYRLRREATELRLRVTGGAPVAVFMYHSVHPDAASGWGPWEYAVTPATFERQLSRLDSQYDILPLPDIVESCLDGSPPTAPTAAITFDDGYRDNLTEVVPILERYDTPATVFVAGRYLDGQPPYEYRLAAKLATATELSVSVGDATVDRELGGVSDRKRVYEQLRRELKFRRSDVRERVLSDIDVRADSSQAMLTSDELRRLGRHRLVDIGAHGYEHVPLTILDDDAVAADVREVGDALETRLDQSVSLFSYPYGAHSDSVVRAVERAGYTAAVTTVPRRAVASRLDAARFCLPRLDQSR